MDNDNLRKVALTDGTCMDDSLYIFLTDAPIEKLKELEKISCDAYINGKGYEDVPVWSEELEKEGYTFNYVDEHPHIGPFDSSESWFNKYYSDVTESYLIENQPELANKTKNSN
jgi:hypothetical protein